MADKSIETLKSRQKAIDREFSDRVKRLQKLKRSINTDFRNIEAGLPIVTDQLSLTPELEKLVLNPTDGL